MGRTDHPTEAPASEVRYRIDGYNACFLEVGGGDVQPRPADRRPDDEPGRTSGHDDIEHLVWRDGTPVVVGR